MSIDAKVASNLGMLAGAGLGALGGAHIGELAGLGYGSEALNDSLLEKATDAGRMGDGNLAMLPGDAKDYARDVATHLHQANVGKAVGAGVGGLTGAVVGKKVASMSDTWATEYFKMATAPAGIKPATPISSADVDRVKKLTNAKPIGSSISYPRPEKKASAEEESWALEYMKLAALGLARPLPANMHATPGANINTMAGNALKVRTRPNIKPQMSNESSSSLQAVPIAPGVPAKMAEAFAFFAD